MKNERYDMKNKEICELIYQEYIDNMELDQTPQLIKNLPLLVDNNVACKIVFSYENLYGCPFRYYYVCKFMQKYNKNIKSHRRVISPHMYGGSESVMARDNKELVKLSKYALNNGVYFAKIDDTHYAVLDVSSSNEDEFNLTSTLHIIGKKWKKIKDKIMKKIDEYSTLRKSQDDDSICYSDRRPPTRAIFKPFDQIIFKGKEDILHYIDNWVENIPTYYEKYNMISKLSIILYGEPGTGKSTFCKALAKYLGLNRIMSISPDYFNRGDNDRCNDRRQLSYDYVSIIYSLDDIDCVCKSREIDDSKNNAEVLANLLEFLDNPPTMYFKARDGVRYPVSIVVATTNYYDKLDSAVTRYGRFDLKIEMPNFTKTEAQEMCDIYDLKLEDIVSDSNKKDFTISPAKLQALCLENIDKSLKTIV